MQLSYSYKFAENSNEEKQYYKKLLKWMFRYQAIIGFNDLHLTNDVPLKLRHKWKIVDINNVDIDYQQVLYNYYVKVDKKHKDFDVQYDKYEKGYGYIMSIIAFFMKPITKKFIDLMLEVNLHTNQKELLLTNGQVDYSLNTPEASFRLHAEFLDEGVQTSPFVTIRKINNEAFSLKQMGINSTILNNFKLGSWLILISWPTGSAKSSTLTTMLDYYNKNEYKKIITLEDPIEFFWDKKKWDKSIIIQREIWKTVKSFSEGIKGAMRGDPDIVIVWEIRDRDTVEAAIELANTWHLVIATVHVKSTTEVLNRILWFFDWAKTKEIAVKLWAVLNFVLNQRLVATTDGTYKVAYEWLNTQVWWIPSLIKDNNLWDIRGSMKELDLHWKNPHKTLNESLFELIVQWKLSALEGKEHYTNESTSIFDDELDVYKKRYLEEGIIGLQELEELIETQNILYNEKKKIWL